MVKITEELVRKKSEHNECIIGTLEELSLHQENVEKIEYLQNWCKNLEILYLQANLISKIENLNKLKKLKYLNLAVNNIEVVENLNRCESLEKLDLTLNFIGNLESVCSLQDNLNLKELYLTGNPCCDFKGYREFVVAKLQQLSALDSKEITKSERIKSFQNFPRVKINIKNDQAKYIEFREEQKRRLLSNDKSYLTDEEFWKTSSENAPETRTEIAYRANKSKRNEENSDEKSTKKVVRLFTNDGRPLNINQAKVKFHFSDEDPKQYVLDIAIYKYMDTNLIDVDLQPTYVKVVIKEKIFQLVFPEEICTDRSNAKRSQTTGHLVITMPRLNYKEMYFKKLICNKDEEQHKKPTADKDKPTRCEFLEVEKNDDMDFSKIVENNNKPKFDDNLNVPPLEYS